LNASGSKRLKLEHEGPVSNLAFKFKLRRYNSVRSGTARTTTVKGDGLALTGDLGGTSIMVGRCRLTL